MPIRIPVLDRADYNLGMTSRPSSTLGALNLRGDGRPTVIIRHDLPDGSHHFDWFLAGDAAGEGPLSTFRTHVIVRDLAPGDMVMAERLPDHRSIYLQFEGSIAGNRGNVRRLNQGRVVGATRRPVNSSETWEVAVEWENDGSMPMHLQNLLLNRTLADEWKIECWEAPRPSSVEPRILACARC